MKESGYEEVKIELPKGAQLCVFLVDIHIEDWTLKLAMVTQSCPSKIIS